MGRGLRRRSSRAAVQMRLALQTFAESHVYVLPLLQNLTVFPLILGYNGCGGRQRCRGAKREITVVL